MATVSARSTLKKDDFIKKIETNLEEIRYNLDQLREMSRVNLLSEKELEEAFNNLYDARDLLDFYTKQMKTTEYNDTLLKQQWTWVRDYMKDLIEFDVGRHAEIHRVVNFNLTNRNGTVIGEGEEIQVRHITTDQADPSLVVYNNWLEIDSAFWLKDHHTELLEYKQDNKYGNTDYYERYEGY